MNLFNFYNEHFSNLCCYEDYLMRIDLMGRKHNDKEILDSLRKCDGHRYIVAGGEVIWIDHNGEKDDNPDIYMISESAFEHCGEIKSMVIPNGVQMIDQYAFYNCKCMESVTIPCTVKFIGMNAFATCDGIKTLVIPFGVNVIGYSAFSYCSGLKSIEIPKSVDAVRSCAFDGCWRLESVKVPKNCDIGWSAFPKHCEVIRY